jgi:DNA primase
MVASQFTTKYVIKGKFDVDGVVEKPDVIGAIFGQTEGLFGSDLDLRELQKTGRVGRIEIDLESKKDKTYGSITITSSLDRVSTSIITAAIESVDRIGPCAAKVTIEKIDDAREEKRKVIIDRAKQILQKWTIESMPSIDEVIKEVSDTMKIHDVMSYGPDELPMGPEMMSSPSIIIVEGRADIINLLRCGIKNTVAVEGAKMPESIGKLSREKEVTAFLDGDRGGDLILKELLQVANVDYVARAPQGKEVEELTPKEIMKALKEKVPIEQIKEAMKHRHIKEGPREPREPREIREREPREPREVRERIEPREFRDIREPREQRTPVAPPVIREVRKTPVSPKIAETVNSLRNTLEAVILNGGMESITRLPVSELAEKLQQIEGADTVIFDGVITQRLVDIAGDKGVKTLVADRISDVTKRPVNMQFLTFNEIELQK